MKKTVIGATGTKPVGYVDRQGRFNSTSQKTFAQLCREASDEADRDVWC